MRWKHINDDAGRLRIQTYTDAATRRQRSVAMSTTGLDVFDTTVQKTNSWLNDIMHEMDWQERRKAYQALRSTLHALRDRLTVDEAAQLAAQLPMLVRGFYYEGWDPTGKPSKSGISRVFSQRLHWNSVVMTRW